MSFDINWDIDKYKEDHESEEHWALRRSFMERWKEDFNEERLVCLARVFANVELLGCRYPAEVMQEIARLSHDKKTYDLCCQSINRIRRYLAEIHAEIAMDKDVEQYFRTQEARKMTSDAAEDRAKGVKREGGIIIGSPSPKNARIQFVKQGETVELDKSDNDSGAEENNQSKSETTNYDTSKLLSENVNNSVEKPADPYEYAKQLRQMKCIDIRYFSERMFNTVYGRMVLLVRPWATKFCNIQSCCQGSNIQVTNSYENGVFSLYLNGKLLAQAEGFSKADAKSKVEDIAWQRLSEQAISVLFKEQWIAQNDAPISVSDVARRTDEFGAPVANCVAAKMMKLMGWKGGGLGADAQGIAEPIKPHLQMVNRAGLGSLTADIRQLRRAGQELMQRYQASDALDVDLVFSSDFSKEERAALHQVAQRAGLASRSYGADSDRFLVVRKKLDPFSLVRAVIEKGGDTPKYQVFIPASLGRGR